MEKLAPEDVEDIFSAFSVAEGEVGKQWEDVKAKLYRIYPEVERAHIEQERRIKEEGAKQRAARKAVADACYSVLDTTVPLLRQVIAWVRTNEDMLHQSYSDEICIAADLWRYHPDLIPALSRELREEIERKHEPWRAQGPGRKGDEDMWHELVSAIEESDRK